MPLILNPTAPEVDMADFRVIREILSGGASSSYNLLPIFKSIMHGMFSPKVKFSKTMHSTVGLSNNVEITMMNHQMEPRP